MNRPPVITLHEMARAILAIPELADIEIEHISGTLWQNQFKRKGFFTFCDEHANPQLPATREVQMVDNNNEETNLVIYRLGGK